MKPTQARIVGQIQSDGVALFYEVAHGNYQYFKGGCIDGEAPEYTRAGEVHEWIADYEKMPFTFLVSCDAVVYADIGSFSYFFRKGSMENTVTMGYAHFAEDECYECYECFRYFYRREDRLWQYLSQGMRCIDAFNQANADYPQCIEHDCVRFVGDEGMRLVPPVPRRPERFFNPGWNYFSLPYVPDQASAYWVLGKWRTQNKLYRWDPYNKQFQLCPDDFMDLETGRGYLMWAEEFRPAPARRGMLVEWNFDIALPEEGWTLIGQPFNHNTLLEACTIRDNASGETRTAWEDHQSPDAWMNWNVLWWDSEAHNWQLLGLEGADDNALHPWYGYLVWSNLRNLTLTIPAE